MSIKDIWKNRKSNKEAFESIMNSPIVHSNSILMGLKIARGRKK